MFYIIADVGVHLHLGEILRDEKQCRRLEAGRHGLADVDVARDDDAVDRRRDVGVPQIDAGFVERGLCLLHTSLISMLITSTGHLLIGAVTPSVLYSAAAHLK